MEGYKAVENSEDQQKGDRSLWAQCQAVADMKFTYVVSCQKYGIHKRSGDPRALDTLRLMTSYVTNIVFLQHSRFIDFFLTQCFHVADIHHFALRILMRLSNLAKRDQIQEATRNSITQRS